MTNKQIDELKHAKRLLETIGFQDVELKCGDRPDILATIDSRRIGIEVTEYHADEGSGGKGSALRAEEEKKARQSNGDGYTMWGKTEPWSGLGFRLEEKTKLAETYDIKPYDELWLLIVAQLPKLGGIAATYAIYDVMKISDMNCYYHEQLCQSKYHAVFFHLIVDGVIYKWTPGERWTVLRSPHKQPSAGRELWFKNVLRDPDWQRDPDAKARQEAHKVIDELRGTQRSGRNGN